MSVFSNMMGSVGAVGNAAGVQGDSPGGLNALQRAALNPEQSMALGKQMAIQKLASDPDFAAASPAEQSRIIASVMGDPVGLAAGEQQAKLANIDLANPGEAIKTVQQYMTPEHGIAYASQTKLKELAKDPAFQSASPADQSKMIAEATGDPAQLAASAQQRAVGSIDLSNPGGALQKLQQYMTPEQITGILTNPMATGMIGGSSGTPPLGPQGTAPQLGGNGSSAPNTPSAGTTPAQPTDDPRRWDYLNSSVPAFYRNQVLDYAQGGELPKDVSPKDKTLISNWAHNFDPTFSDSVGTQRNATVKDFSPSGKSGQGLTSAGIATKHLAQLALDTVNLKNGSVPAANFIANHWDKTFGGDSVTNAESDIDTVSPEIAKAAAGGGDTDKDMRQDMKDSFSTNGSPKQLLGTIAGKVDLISSKAKELEGVYHKNMGVAARKDFSALSPVTAQTQKDIKTLHTLSKIDPNFKTQQAQDVIARLKNVVSLEDSKFLPKDFPGTAANESFAPAEPPPASPPAALPTPEQAREILRQRGRKI